jgi:endonuclease/exonuclease/phosphatase family metal-dependent hydrolase
LAAGCTRTEKIQPRPIDFTDAAGAVRVMTFNIRYGLADDGDNGWRRRRELVFDVPADHAADVIGLQEALNFQIKEIKQALEPYAVISAGRNDGRYAGQACPILYRSVCGTRFGDFLVFQYPVEAGIEALGQHAAAYLYLGTIA